MRPRFGSGCRQFSPQHEENDTVSARGPLWKGLNTKRPCGLTAINPRFVYRRLAVNLLSKVQGQTVTVFLMGEALAAAKTGQQTPNGYYNLERMVKAS
jgi:hypothetical protein